MKKIALILAAILAVGALLVSCAKDEPKDDNKVQDDGAKEAVVLTLEELQAATAKIYEKCPLPFMYGDFPQEMINAESIEYYTGIKEFDTFAAVNVSESMLGSQAYSLVMASVKADQDVQAVADAMINGINMRKWMCVGADTIRTVVSGNTVMLVMIDTNLGLDVTVDDFVNAFTEVVGTVDYEAEQK